MAYSNDSTADDPIKYESPHQHEPPPTCPSNTSPMLKRQRAGEDIEAGLKRQRIDSYTMKSEEVTDDFAALLAQATESSTQQLHDISQPRQRELVIIKEEPSRDEGRLSEHNDSETRLVVWVQPYYSMDADSTKATQILASLAEGPYTETIRMVTQLETELGQTYSNLKSLFDQTKQLYSQQGQFLSADELHFEEPGHRAIIRTANLASFASGVFGGQDIGFLDLNQHFIETFTPDGEPLSEESGKLYLSLKIQMYLSAVTQDEQDQTKEDLLESFFPIDLDQMLLARHSGTILPQSELGFVEASRECRESFMSEGHDVESIQILSEKHPWEDFLRKLGVHLNQATEAMLTPYIKRHSLIVPASNARELVQNAMRDMVSSIETDSDFMDEINRATEAALHGFDNQDSSCGNDIYQQEYNGQAQPPLQKQLGRSSITGNCNLFPGDQSAPTQVLYEQARQAAVAKQNPGNTRGRPGLPSQRRPWTQDEEFALMAGLDEVKGPHWSSILALYGPNGSVNNQLKDRNQVQLKDKARNLKLFFLKSGIEVPYYLKSVTGELKTRAPTQAARREAEALAKSEDARAQYDGIAALTGMTHSLQGISESHMLSSPRSKGSSSISGSEDSQTDQSPSNEDAISDDQVRLLVQEHLETDGVQPPGPTRLSS